MTFTTTLKRICDICFYLAFAAFFAVVFGGTSLVATLPLFAIVAFLTALLGGWGVIRFVPLVLLGWCFFIVQLHVANVLVLIPACIYLVYVTYMPHQDFDYTFMFKGFLWAFVIFILILLLFGLRPELEISTFPFGVVFLISAVLLLRMLRHERHVMDEQGFNVLNIISIALVIGVGFILSSERAVLYIRTMMGMFYFNILAPFLGLIIAAFGFAMQPIIKWLLGRDIDRSVFDFDLGMMAFDDIEYTPQSESGRFAVVVTNLLYVFLCVIVVILLIKLIRKFRKHTPSFESKGLLEQRTELVFDKAPIQKRNTNKIREIYRKFLLLCRREGIRIEPYMTSLNIEHETLDKLRQPHSKKLRDIYIKVRYGDADISKKDIQEAKTLLRGCSKKSL